MEQDKIYCLIQDVKQGLEEMELIVMAQDVLLCDLDNADILLNNILSLLKEFSV